MILAYQFKQLLLGCLSSTLSRADLMDAQKDDLGLKPLFAAILPPEDVASGYFIDDGVLLRKWLAQREDCRGELSCSSCCAGEV